MEHAFRYPLFLIYLDLDELPRCSTASRSGRRAGPAPRGSAAATSSATRAVPLRERGARAVEERTGRRPDGPVRLLTSVRTFGIVFNPVVLYYCFDPSGEQVEAVAAEVTNTPWGERHTYVLERRCGPGASTLEGFHVSPFLGMEADYQLRATTPGGPSRCTWRAAPAAPASTPRCRSRAASSPRCAAALPLPAPSLRVVAGSTRRPLRLKLKGAPTTRIRAR